MGGNAWVEMCTKRSAREACCAQSLAQYDLHQSPSWRPYKGPCRRWARPASTRGQAGIPLALLLKRLLKSCQAARYKHLHFRGRLFRESISSQSWLLGRQAHAKLQSGQREEVGLCRLKAKGYMQLEAVDCCNREHLF